MTVDVRSAVTRTDLSLVLMWNHIKVPCRR